MRDTKVMTFLSRAAICCFLSVFAACAQDAALAGHYEGKLQAPNRELDVTFDLYQDAGKAWAGHITIVPGPREVPLKEIKAGTDSVSFTVDAPNPPRFEGKFDPAAKSIKGTISGGQASAPFEVKRTGDGKPVVVVESSKLTKEFEGRWEGTLETGGPSLRVVLTIAPDAKGNASATLVSVDQGGQSIPVTAIIISGSELSFEVKLVNGSYKGKLNEPKTEITGAWVQQGNSLPLTLKRADSAASEKK
ncbi:MAG TPA: hypothetical protein VES20_22990 [Bryobacteraceae bacterium]|nr:hypothetical protein [Bryobacteraceae bacterium]